MLPAGAAPEGHVWLAAEPLGGLMPLATDVQVGDKVAIAVRQGASVKVELVCVENASDSPSPARISKQKSEDALKADKDGEEVRTQWVDPDEQGERFKRWRALCGRAILLLLKRKILRAHPHHEARPPTWRRSSPMAQPLDPHQAHRAD